MKATAILTLGLFLAVALSGCGIKQGPTMVTVQTTKGVFHIELYNKESPVTVDNFRKYVTDGFFDGTFFHRISKNFVIQGGGFDNATSKQKNATYPPIINEAKSSKLLNLKYTLSMARTSDPNSATTQFFINLVNNTALDPNAQSAGYAVFGKVTAGRDVIDAIAQTPTNTGGAEGQVCASPPREPSCPLVRIVILSARIGAALTPGVLPSMSPTNSTSPAATM